MAENEKPPVNDDSTAPITSERLRDMVLDHLLENSHLFLAENANITQRFTGMLDSITELAHTIATQAIANRQCLSPLKTFDGTIQTNPDDDKHYELRYRLVEQIGNNPPYKDNVFTLAEAREIYGDSFIENYWGMLGERCPNRITTGEDRHLWFTAVRYPAENMEHNVNARAASRPRQKS